MPDKQRFQAVIDKHLCKTFGLAPALEANGAKSLAVAVENHPQDSRLKETGDLAPTIPSQAGTGGVMYLSAIQSRKTTSDVNRIPEATDRAL